MSLAAIEELVEELEIGLDRRELLSAFVVRDKLDARLAVAVARYEQARLHEVDGAGSMAGWLRQQAGRDAQTAAKLTWTGRKLQALPALREAVLAGTLSGGQLEAVVANVPMRHLDAFAAQEAELVPRLSGLSVEHTRRAMQHWKRCADTCAADRPADEHKNELYLAKTLDARGELRGSFESATTAVLEAALRTAEHKDFDVPAPRRRAEALAQICQHFLDHQQVRTGARHRPHLNVTITYEDLAAGIGGRYLDTDQPVPPDALGVLTCDGAYHRFLYAAASARLDYGRATRVWPGELYNAIVLRDGGCRVGTCDAPPSWCDVHHVIPWEHGGETSIDNGLLACRRHHHLAHRPGYHLKLLPDGTTELTHPDGRVELNRPRAHPDQFWQPGGS